jgi:hypothetical protein
MMTTKIKFVAALALSASALVPAHADVLTNGGFESGNSAGWSIGGAGTSGCDANFSVASSGAAAGCTGYAPIPSGFVGPQSGQYAAYAAFDGNGPENHTLTQTFGVPVGLNGATVTWFDALGFGTGWSFPVSRVYTVDLLNSSNAVVANLWSESFSGGGTYHDWTGHSVDISAYLASLSGQNASLRFNLYVPQSFTGPGVFALDTVSIDAHVPEPDSIALLALGMLGLGFVRRARKG